MRMQLTALGAVLSFATFSFAHAQTISSGGAAVSTTVPRGVKIDYENAKPMPLPQGTKQIPSRVQMTTDAAKASFSGPAQIVEGADGTGKGVPTTLPVSKYIPPASDATVAPQEYGSSGQPYTTSLTTAVVNPARRAGKLFFNIGSSSYVCSASLIKKGIVVTAAHCVSNFGASQFYSGWQFVPAYTNGNAPFGVWTTQSATVLTSYYNGSDSCYQRGVICQDDVALLVLSPQSGAYVGTQTGYFGYSTNGYSFSAGQALISQLGYPVALNNGVYMERTDSLGSVNSTFSNNTIIGSLQTGGSSGGPWLVNFGAAPTITGSGTGFGTQSAHNIVAGVTSWGYTDTSSTGPKQQGASSFTSGNIGVLINSVCTAHPDAC